MTQLEDLLTRAMSDLATDTGHDPDLAATIRRRSRWRRTVMIAPVAAAVAVIALAAALLISRPSSPETAVPQSASSCGPLVTAVLPTWARTGFTDPEPEMPFVTSRSGGMVAIVFGVPLSSPPAADHQNKILWVTNVGGVGDLVITGTREGGSETMTTTVSGAPGPSYVDVPVPGCWHFDLAWAGHYDSIDLAYVTP